MLEYKEKNCNVRNCNMVQMRMLTTVKGQAKRKEILLDENSKSNNKEIEVFSWSHGEKTI